jgi:hypothetical protein
MELLCALLAGFFFWLLRVHWFRTARAQAREAAGPLLLEVEIRTPFRSMSLILAAIYLLSIPLFAYCARDNPTGLAFMMYAVIAMYLSMSLSDVSRFCRRTRLEVREHGLLHGGLWLMAWSDVVSCKWASNPEKLLVQLRFSRAEMPVSREQTDALTGVLGRFVPVYDAEGALLTKPPAVPRPAEVAPPRRRSRRYLLQFDLQFLLLLTVVVACAASCYGIRHRRMKPQWDSLARLETFHARIDRDGDKVWEVDFSNCTNKPTDDDLIWLESLDELHRVDLSGAPVTDAGLAHLKGLKSLRWVDLTNTRVTARGVEELQRALPGAHIRTANTGPSLPAPPLKAANKKG